MELVENIIYSIHFFIPGYLANMFAFLLGGGKPLDFYKNFIDGRRLLGDGVTIRGTFFGISLGFLYGLMFYYMIPNPYLPINIYELSIISFLISLGAILGGMVGSFIKRRLGLRRGAPFPILDQLNFVIGGIALCYIYYEIPTKIILILLIITPIFHLLSNVIAYLLGIKKEAW